MQLRCVSLELMKEATFPVKTEKLQALSTIHRQATIARRLGVSRQLWANYVNGVHDMRDSLIDKLCDEYQLKRSELVKTA